ncbi:MAG: hypothetical protein GWN93_14565, partial [Deltaproteobacteria bacterium]|nr:hypothetical protein [Deltaproteobacteria bacterium]
DCPADAFEPVTTECRAAAGVCDAADNCDGVSAACPADAKLTSECRASAGVCDVAEVCDGVADDCPADAFEPECQLGPDNFEIDFGNYSNVAGDDFDWSRGSG